ncbi:ATP-binding protein [Singulisphaera sp. Ch08]|uniref:histidine kinase n=1 Tax=Singulisphaera sp. Ch08 TaxID=3120278 RepID=A0AAU7CF05_9BACT
MRPFAQSIVETVREPLLVLDAELRVWEANISFYQAFRVSPGQTEGRPIHELGAGQWDIPPLRRLLDEVNATGRAFRDFEVDHDIPGLGRRAMLLNARRIHREDDHAPMILLAIEDVTEQKQAREELRRLNAELEHRVRERTAQLEASNKELEAFCYSVSHDLQAPLRAIDGFSQELLASHAGQLDDQGRHYLERIRAGGQRMAQLIADLLQLSRLSRSEMQQQRVDLSGVAREVADDLRQREPGRDVSFVIEPGVSGFGDPRLLRLVLENLLGNAWKFTAKQPRATIAFERAETEGGRAYAVRDDGAGFDMAFAGKLFGAFQRLHSDRDFPGTGIGLAIVQRVIHRHGGRVWGEGAVERGASFSFTLPPRPSAPTSDRPEP